MIPTRAPDVESWLLATLGPAFDGAPVRVTKPKLGVPYRCVVVRADLQNKVTPISRYARLGVQAWSVRTDGSGHLKDAFDLGADVAAALEEAPTVGIVVSPPSVQAGPYRVADTTSGVEYAYFTALMEVAVTLPAAP